MKAILFPFSPMEPSVELTKDFPELDWTIVASPEDVARAKSFYQTVLGAYPMGEVLTGRDVPHSSSTSSRTSPTSMIPIHSGPGRRS